MTGRSSAAALLTILRRKLVPATQLAELAEDHGDAEALLRELAEPQELFPDGAGDLDADLEAARSDLAVWEERGIHSLSVFDEHYPLNLRTVHDRPAILTFRGSLKFDDANSVAIVGTRKASEHGTIRARRLSSQLVEAGYVIASGLAAGIDTAAHEGALAAEGRTVAVIGTGLDHAFPKPNAALQDRLGRESAVVSQFWPDQGPRPWTFPLRNAVMSGFALATVVVEASKTSGAKMQARLALEHGRPVFLLQSLVDGHEWAQEYAERPGVYVVGATEQVVERLERLYPAELVAL